MSASPTGRAPATHPNPPPKQAPGQRGSSIGRFLGLLGRLILYGHVLAERLSQGAGTPAFARLASNFGTTDLAAILRRITRGLMLAAALHERLSKRATRGCDISPTPVRVRSPRKPPAAPRPRAKRAKPQAAADVVALPTPEQIAAMLRRRPLGAVIVDICLDLGITRGDVDPELWRELHAAIFDYGGSFTRYIAGATERSFSSPSPCGKIEPRNGSMPQSGSMPRSGSMGEAIETSPPVRRAVATGPP